MTKTFNRHKTLLIGLSLLTIAVLLAAGNEGRICGAAAMSFHLSGI